MASYQSLDLLRDPILRQIVWLPWIWRKEAESNFTRQALVRLSLDLCCTDAWRCLAAMTLEDPDLHMAILRRILVIDPGDVSARLRLSSYESDTRVVSEYQ
jgi:hypothetical protein